MPRYVAEFRKRVLSDNGQESMSVQRRFDVDARDRVEARRVAEERFCKLENVDTWRSHADELHVVEAEFPS